MIDRKFNSERPEFIKKCKSKLAFPSKEKAQYKCYYFKHYYQDGKDRTPYFCKSCGNWHITTSIKSGNVE
jgi:hypothetical protein